MICFYYIGRCNGVIEETGSCCWPFYNAHSPHFTLLFTSEPWCTPLMFAYVSLFHGRHSWLGLPCHVRLSSACVLYRLTASLQVASSCLFQHGHHRHKLTSVQVEVWMRRAFRHTLAHITKLAKASLILQALQRAFCYSCYSVQWICWKFSWTMLIQTVYFEHYNACKQVVTALSAEADKQWSLVNHSGKSLFSCCKKRLGSSTVHVTLTDYLEPKGRVIHTVHSGMPTQLKQSAW